MLCALMFSTASAADAPSNPALDAAERILKEAKSLKEFLEDSVLQRWYFQAMREYLGYTAISEQAFQLRIDKLRELLPLIPELDERLWKVEPTGELFDVKSESKSYARSTNMKALAKFYERWADQYLIEATPLAHHFARKDALASDYLSTKDDLVPEIEGMIQQHESAVADLPQFYKNRANKKFYSDLRQSKKYQELRSFLMRRFLVEEAQRDLFRVDNPDALLGVISSWREDPSRIAPSLLSPGQRILSLLRDEIPSVTSLLSTEVDGTRLFPPAFQKRNDGKIQNAQKNGDMHWVSRPVPRRFHAIFSPCIHKECVMNNSERWLVPAISGSRFWYTENNGQVSGSAQLVPVDLDGKTYFSLDLSSPDFSRTVNLAGNLGQTRSSIFSRWLTFAQKSLPTSHAGILVGESTQGDNGLSLRNAIHPSSAYRYEKLPKTYRD